MQETDDQVLAKEKKAMGPELGELFHATSNELTWLHWLWAEYRKLFADDPSHLDLMNDSSPFFFQVVHDTIFESTLLGIARLVAPPKSLGNPNLTIQHFCPIDPRHQSALVTPLMADPTQQAELKALIEKAVAAAEFALDWRHRHLAHRDLALALKKPVKPLADASRENIKSALSALGEVLNFIEKSYSGSITAYAFVVSPWGAKNLLETIKDGLARQK